MGKFVCAGALLQCSFGMTPSSFMVADPMRPKVQNKPMGNIMDNKPMVNIMPFGMCQSMANPTVASATAAAMASAWLTRRFPTGWRALIRSPRPSAAAS